MSNDIKSFIHEGNEGWLFLTAGSNNVIGQFNASKLMRQRLTAWRRLIVARTNRCRTLGITYAHVIVPEKLTIYGHKLAGLRIDMRLSPALRLRSSLWWRPRARRACIDLVGAFKARCDAEDLYFRTDSHWSFAGRLIAYRAICGTFNAVPREDFLLRPCHEQDFTGDLGAKFDPPRSEIGRFFDLQQDSMRVHASPIVESREASGLIQTLHVGAHVIYRNEHAKADPRRLLLFGDSYSHFAPSMMMIMLAETFREVHFVWSSAVDWSYVEMTRPDLLLTQIAERFMFQVPDDNFDLTAYAAERFGDELQALGVA